MEETELESAESFSFGNSLLFYRVFLKKRGVILRGEEILKGKRVYSKEISFSECEKEKVLAFYKILIQSRTHPQMMEELAEEFFF